MSSLRRGAPWHAETESFWEFFIVACVAAVGLAGVAYAHDDDPPSHGQIAFATDVSNLLFNEVVAALFKEFDETTPQNVEHGKQAISLIFNDANRDVRLVGAFGPLQGVCQQPSGRQVRDDGAQACARRRRGHRRAEDQRYLVLSTLGAPQQHAAPELRALPHEFHGRLFQPHQQPEQWVGMLVLDVPIRSTHSH